MSVQDNSYRVVIETELDDQELFIEFDKVDDTDISSESDITTHPLVNGDTIADHMYRTPVTMSINGSFSKIHLDLHPFISFILSSQASSPHQSARMNPG